MICMLSHSLNFIKKISLNNNQNPYNNFPPGFFTCFTSSKIQFKISLLYRKLSNYVAKQLRSISGDNEKEDWLTRIAEQLLNQNLQTPNIEMEHIKRAILECVRPEASLKDTETILNVINAFEIPKVQFEIGRKKFIIHNVDKDLYPDAIHKSNVFKDRLDLLYYRTLRHPLFSPSRFGETDQVKLELVPIEYVLSEAKTENVYVIGLLSQLTEGQFYLEDSHGSVKVDLRKAISFFFKLKFCEITLMHNVQFQHQHFYCDLISL